MKWKKMTKVASNNVKAWINGFLAWIWWVRRRKTYELSCVPWSYFNGRHVQLTRLQELRQRAKWRVKKQITASIRSFFYLQAHLQQSWTLIGQLAIQPRLHGEYLDFNLLNDTALAKRGLHRDMLRLSNATWMFFQAEFQPKRQSVSSTPRTTPPSYDLGAAFTRRKVGGNAGAIFIVLTSIPVRSHAI